MTTDDKQVNFTRQKTAVIPSSPSKANDGMGNRQKANSNDGPSNTHMLPKYRDRKQYLLKLSCVPLTICVIAFARAAFYRLIQYHPSACRQFGWYSSSSGEFTCDHKPLDFHAKSALIWLATFAIQVGLLAGGGRLASYHK